MGPDITRCEVTHYIDDPEGCYHAESKNHDCGEHEHHNGCTPRALNLQAQDWRSVLRECKCDAFYNKAHKNTMFSETHP